MSGVKLDQATLATRQLIAELREDGRLTTVHFGSNVRRMDELIATEPKVGVSATRAAAVVCAESASMMR